MINYAISFDNYRKLINVEKYLPKSIRIAFDWTKRIVFTLGPYFSFSHQMASQWIISFSKMTRKHDFLDSFLTIYYIFLQHKK